jgi:hypothetical protein
MFFDDSKYSEKRIHKQLNLVKNKREFFVNSLEEIKLVIINSKKNFDNRYYYDINHKDLMFKYCSTKKYDKYFLLQ